MTTHTLWLVYDAMKHGFTCHNEYHPKTPGWYEIICAKASQATGWKVK